MPDPGQLRLDEIRERLRAVHDPVALLEGIFAHAPLALQIYDKGGRSIITNKAFRDLFGSEPPPEYDVREDEIARDNGVLELIRGAFRGETNHLPPVWYDPRELRQVKVEEGKRVAIEATFFPLWGSDGSIAHVAVVFKDVTAERLALERAEQERDLLRLILERSGDGVVVADAEGVVSIFNPEAERQHGVPLRRVGPAEWSETYGLLDESASPLPLDRTPLYRALHGEKVERAEWRVRRPDGSIRTLVGTATPLRRADGSSAGAVLVTRDETERLEREEERAKLLRDAEDANRAKDEFLAMLGHELRNPLAPIVTALELLRIKNIGEGSRELAVVRRQVEHVQRIVDDLLDISRVTRGKLELRRAPLPLAAIVERAMETASTLFEQRQQHVAVELAPALWVDGDEARLTQVLLNLLTNAARYTAPGGHVSIATRRDGTRAILEVTDDGAGIDPALLPTLFEPFVQGPRAPSQAAGGLGLGLTLVKRLAELHGGRVEAESRGVGLGATFRVSFPAVAPAARAGAPAPTSPPGSGARRVLVVDDNLDAADLMAEALRSAGHDVAVAHDGPTALAQLASFTPDVAVLDIGLPVMDGYELAAELARRVPGVRCVALTGYGQARDFARSRAAGFEQHLVKPITPDTLLAVVTGQERG